MARKRARRRSPGEGSLYWREDTQKWQAALVTGVTSAGNPKRIKKSFDDRDDALDWLADQRSLRSRGANLNASTATLTEAFEDWITHAEKVDGLKPATITTYTNVFRNHILPILGPVRLRDLTPSDFRRLLRQLKSDRKSDSAIRRAYSYVSILMNDCVNMELVSSNPVQKVKAPPVPRPMKERWTMEEFHRMIRTCETVDNQAARYTLIALGTGLRTEEMLGLTWASIDWEHQALDVVTFAEGTGKKILVSEGKTSNSVRRVHVGGTTLEALRRQYAYVRELKAARIALDEKRVMQGKKPLGWTEADLVFCTSLGTILDRTTLRREFNRLIAQAGVSAIRLYSTRSTHLSVLADEGVSLLDLQERAGHSDPRFTAKVYLSGSDMTRRRVADRIEARMRGKSGAEAPSAPAAGAPDTTREANSASWEVPTQATLEPNTD